MFSLEDDGEVGDETGRGVGGIRGGDENQGTGDFFSELFDDLGVGFALVEASGWCVGVEEVDGRLFDRSGGFGSWCWGRLGGRRRRCRFFYRLGDGYSFRRR